jgi:hypothetical protein
VVVLARDEIQRRCALPVRYLTDFLKPPQGFREPVRGSDVAREDDHREVGKARVV